MSTEHYDVADGGTILNKIREDIKNILIPRVVTQLPEATQALFKDYIILIQQENLL